MYLNNDYIKAVSKNNQNITFNNAKMDDILFNKDNDLYLGIHNARVLLTGTLVNGSGNLLITML